MHGESLSSDSSAAESFKTTLLDFLKNSGFALEVTVTNLKPLPGKSLASRQEKAAPGFKVNKKRITAENAEHALLLLVIGKSKEPSCFKNVTQLTFTYRAQKSA